MLVLSRRMNEKIVIPSLNITIQVVAIKPGVVRIGIQAPPEVSIMREELLSESVLEFPSDVASSDLTPAPTRNIRLLADTPRAAGLVPTEAPPE